MRCHNSKGPCKKRDKGTGRRFLLPFYLVRTHGASGKGPPLWQRIGQLAPGSRIPHPPQELDIDCCRLNVKSVAFCCIQPRWLKHAEIRKFKIIYVPPSAYFPLQLRYACHCLRMSHSLTLEDLLTLYSWFVIRALAVCLQISAPGLL